MEQQVISSDLIRGHIDTIILHTLLSGDKFAQQISDAIEEKSDKEYKINQATLYSSLKRLESLRYVKSYWNDSENGRRKYFKLTDSGKNTVELNLSSWSFSRAIIDKLMDCTPQPVYRTQYVEKIIEKPIETNAITPSATPPQTESAQQAVQSSQEKPVQQQDNKPEDQATVTENTQEINFRNILNGLIKASVVQKPAIRTAEDIQPVVRNDLQEKPVEVQKFNETITSIDYNAERNNNGKIDFGDLTLKAAKEGYKIRISSKDSYIMKGNLLINKLNAISSVIAYFISIIAILVVSYGIANNAVWNKYVSIIGATVFAVIPMIYTAKFLKAPRETSSKQVSADSILTSAIIVFDLVLIAVAANLIFNVDFSDVNTIALSLILPVVLCIIFGFHSVIRFYFSKLKSFKLKNK